MPQQEKHAGTVILPNDRIDRPEQSLVGTMLPPHVLKGIEMGLIPIEHVIVWADSEIIASDKPEMWLIELATRDTPDMIGLLQEHGASTEVDAETLLALVSYGFFHSRLALEQVRAELYPFFCANDSKQHRLWILDPRTMKNRKTRAQLHGVHRKGGRGLTSLRSMITIFDDELGWDRSRARRTCEAILQPFSEAGERLLRECNSLLGDCTFDVEIDPAPPSVTKPKEG